MTKFSNKLKNPVFAPFSQKNFGAKKKISQKIQLCHAQLHMEF